MDQADIPGLLVRLQSDEDAIRKMAVFKLQNSINDPSFADAFISSGGVNILRRLLMATSGNTLAYSLQSLTKLLEVDMGWEVFEASGGGELVERLVELIVTHPLVNILRGAMSILVGVVGHSQNGRGSINVPSAFGFRALKPAIAVYPQFFEMVVSQLNSADHALCGNALMLLNTLMRDSLQSDGGYIKDSHGKTTGVTEEWPKFVKRLTDLGVMTGGLKLMQSSAFEDLARPLLEFQGIMKVILRRWRDVKVDLDRPEHRRGMKAMHAASAPPDRSQYTNGNSEFGLSPRKSSKRHNPEKWRRLGFETETPAWEFGQVGMLGLMDMTHYVAMNEDGFQKMLLEQSTKPKEKQCPIARASLAVTLLLYEHFEIDKSDTQDAKNNLVLDGMTNLDTVFKPMLFSWSRIHMASLRAFFRLWKETGAEQEDFDRVIDLLRVLIEQVVGTAPRTKEASEVQEELLDFDVAQLRKVQMDMLDYEFQQQLGQDIEAVKQALRNEAIQFMREQRIRCLLQGAWFPTTKQSAEDEEYNQSITGSGTPPTSIWRYVKLSHNRRFLHYGDSPYNPFEEEGSTWRLNDLPLDELVEKIDLGTVSSVLSIPPPSGLYTTAASHPPPSNFTTLRKITISKCLSPSHPDCRDHDEVHILQILPTSDHVASEFLDGLLMLLGQAPITDQTLRCVNEVAEYGVRLRLVNLRAEDVENRDGGDGRGKVPTREGRGEDYWFVA